VAALSNAQIGKVIHELLNAPGSEQVRRLLRANRWLVDSADVDDKLTQVIANKYRARDLPSVAVFTACRGFLRRCRLAGVNAALRTQPGWPLSTQGPLLQMLALAESECPVDLLIEQAQVALEDVEPESEADLYGLVLYRLGLGYQDQAEKGSTQVLDQAIARFEAAVRAWGQLDSWFGQGLIGQAQHNLGRLYWKRRYGDRRQNIEIALGWLEQALESTGERTAECRDALILMGDVYLHRIAGGRLENIETAISYYKQANRLVKRQVEQEQHPVERDMLIRHLAGIEHNLAVSYRMRLYGNPSDNYEQAKDMAERALGRLDRDVFPEDWARTTGELATIYNYRIQGKRDDNLERAIEYAEQALKIYRPDTHPQQWTLGQLTLGNLYCDRISGLRAQNDGQAIRCFRSILDCCDPKSDPLRWSEAMNNLGTVYASRSTCLNDANYRQAIDCYRLALKVRTPETLPAQALQTATNIGNLGFWFDNWSEAIDGFRSALQAGEALYLGSSTEIGRRAELAETWRSVARASYCWLRMGQLDRALIQLERGKARLLADAMILVKLAAPERQAMQKARQSIRELQTEMRLPLDTPGRRSGSELTRELAGAHADIVRLVQTDLAKQSAPTFVDRDLPLIFNQIPVDGALVAPLVTPRGSAVFVLPAGAQRVEMEHIITLSDFTERDLDALLVGTRQNPGWLRAYAAWREGGPLQEWKEAIETFTSHLWQILMEAVHKRLKVMGLTEGAPVTLLPQGGLGLMPLHAAWREVNGIQRAFLDDYTVSYAPSAFVLSVIRQRLADEHRQKPNLLAVVNPTGDLLFASREGRTVTEIFSGARLTLTERDATQEAVLREAPERTYLHFACHGSYGWQDVMHSALVLAGGYRFTLPEIVSKLDLDVARLVTLSACETGLTEFQETPDEYIGLPAAFLQVGVPEVVSSLWAVDDLSTALLMEDLYHHHLQEGLSIGQALRAAQRWLRQEVDRSMVVDHIQSLLSELEARHAEVSKDVPFGEAAYDLGRHIHRLKQEFEAWLKEEKRDPGGRPFNHPYHWAAFTVWSPNVDVMEVKLT
jgi:CHAT domain-containing protein/tetratricopeptide (TPR) repeat protein